MNFFKYFHALEIKISLKKKSLKNFKVNQLAQNIGLVYGLHFSLNSLIFGVMHEHNL